MFFCKSLVDDVPSIIIEFNIGSIIIQQTGFILATGQDINLHYLLRYSIILETPAIKTVGFLAR
jgi:hypothetical protein